MVNQNESGSSFPQNKISKLGIITYSLKLKKETPNKSQFSKILQNITNAISNHAA